MLSVLQIDSSGRYGASVSRHLTDYAAARVATAYPGTEIARRDISQGMPFVDETMIASYFTPAEQRTDAQKAAIVTSNTLVAEVKSADILVLGVPVYNFGPPAAFKAWIDQIARARETFRYREGGGVEGLLKGTKAIVVVTSGGTEIGGDLDFLTGWLRHVLGFIGIEDVSLVAVDGLVHSDRDHRISAAKAAIDQAVESFHKHQVVA